MMAAIRPFSKVIYEFRDQYESNLRVIQNVASTGMQNIANFAIKNSDNEYIAIHDDDTGISIF